MPWSFTVYSLPPLVAAAISAVVAAESWRHREKPGATTFLVLMLVVTVWSATYAIQLGHSTVAGQLLWQRVGDIPGAFVAPLFLAFALQYAGLDRVLTPWVGAALAVDPVVYVVLVWTNGAHGLVWRDASMAAVGPAIELSFGPAYFVHVAVAYAMVVVGVGVIGWIAAGAARTHRRQAAMIVLAAVVPLGANVAFTLGLSPVPGLDFTTATFALTGSLMALALFRLDLLDIAPVARRHWIEQLGDGVVVVGPDGTVSEADEVARQVLDPPPTVGEPVAESLPADDPAAAAGTVVTASVEGTRRHYDIRHAELRDHHGQRAGALVGLRDVTDRTEYEQRLHVANRVLRHNFRNAMNVVLGHAGALAADLDGDAAERARTIERRGEEVVDLAEQIKQVVTTMERRATETVDVDVTTVVARAVDDVRASAPGAEIGVDIDVDASPLRATVVDADLLELAVRNLVENAVEHNETGDPRVEVAVRRRDDRVEVRVADHGPGIPPAERAVIERGEETPLQHGSGLGLWVVSWVVSATDGEVSFEENEPRGSVVVFDLPAASGEGDAVDPAESSADRRLEETPAADD